MRGRGLGVCERGEEAPCGAPNEGLVIGNLTAMGAVGMVRLYVNIEFAITSSF